ncbi:MAG TPA: glycosyltransferase family 4 protein [Fimbriimonadaceae bacterium]|nr:glycosyltransferase family 4 protein [Fimbriimonadaceae bacterium]HRJ32438.1 glycosyltransferase family 4 protein [Fimbriimonadaceae bacterium]
MPRIVVAFRCAYTLSLFRSSWLRRLVRDGWEVHGVGRGGDGFESAVEATGAQFHAVPLAVRSRNPLTDLRFQRSLRDLFIRIQPDVVHLHTIKPVIYGARAARQTGVPRVVSSITGLGYVFSGSAPSWMRRLVEAQYRRGLQLADAVTFCNSDDRQLFMDRGLVTADKASVVVEGVDLTQITPKQAVTGPLQVLMVGRLLRDKGVLEYAEAVRQLRPRFPEVEFAILGGRDEHNPTVVDSSEVQRWDAEGGPRWLGEVAPSEVTAHLSRSFLVVLPSYREGSPKALIEAGAQGLPVVATDVAGCRDVVRPGVTGLLVPAKDPAALTQAISRLLEDVPLAQQMGLAARDWIAKEFDEQRMLDRLTSLVQGERCAL